MNPFQLYNDIQVDIEILQDQIEACMNERKQWLAGGRLFNTVPLDNAFLRVDKLSEKIEKLDEQLILKCKMKINLEVQLRRYQDISYQILYKRNVEKKSLKMIADELNYSYDHIKRLSSRLKRAT